MYFHKIDNPANFLFGDDRATQVRSEISALGENVFRVQYSSKLWRSNNSFAVLDETAFSAAEGNETGGGQGAASGALGAAAATARLDARHGDGFALTVDGRLVIETRGGLGLCGRKWVVRLRYDAVMRFYGLGEKCGPLEKTGIRTKFWNTDVFADFHAGAIAAAETDPMYVSIPYVLIRTEIGYAGILLDNPYPVFMNLGAVEGVAQQKELETSRDLYFGAPDGRPVIYVIFGPTAVAVTSKLQRLCGTTPRPPLWSIGHQQCRWGYESYDDLKGIQQKFQEEKIPNDGLWIDIEYMDGYRVFTFDAKNFSDPSGQIGDLVAKGAHVCPILDPGVKVDPDYAVYREGLEKNVFCLNSNGEPFVGFVWPGKTVFPDFSLEHAREFWAEHVKQFAQRGVSGVWVDMNDPSTGSSEPEEMRFDHGKQEHGFFHNQYALGMQMATRDGFLRANPNRRPFVISRSGYISSSRFSAIWTGDNLSSWTYLALTIPMCLNLSISGVPFVGSDVGGFGDDCTPELLVAWYKAAFLFPFFRNHSMRGTHRQEPWAMGPAARNVIRSYIRLRYRMLPYLYNLFVAQEAAGAPILRPLFMGCSGSAAHPLDTVNDQFMVGPAVMQAPVLEKGTTGREVLLPPGTWFDPWVSRWMSGDRKLTVDPGANGTPLYFREDTIVPMLPEEPETNRSDLSIVQFHLFLRRESKQTGSDEHGSAEKVRVDRSAEYQYTFDDGISFDYRSERKQSVVSIRAIARGSELELQITGVESGFGELSAEFVVYDDFNSVRIVHGGRERAASLHGYTWVCCGNRVSVRRTDAMKF